MARGVEYAKFFKVLEEEEQQPTTTFDPRLYHTIVSDTNFGALQCASKFCFAAIIITKEVLKLHITLFTLGTMSCRSCLRILFSFVRSDLVLLFLVISSFFYIYAHYLVIKWLGVNS